MTVTLLITPISMGANQNGTKTVFYDPNEVKPYVSYLKNHAKPPLKYVTELFDTYDLVILSERTHPETTQWEFIYELTSDPTFIKDVGHIFTEYGSVLQQPSIDELLNTRGLSEKEIERRIIGILRDFPIHPYGWNNNNFFDYLKRLYRLNQSLTVDKKIKLFFSDVPWQWEGKTRKDYDVFWKTELPHRDKIMADRVISKFREILKSDAKRKKALVIMNTRHAYKTGGSFNTGDFIFRAFPRKTAIVMFNTKATNLVSVNEQSTTDFPIQGGKWDAAFWMLGNTPMGFDFKHSPFGKDPFDLHEAFAYSGLKYEDVFTGMIFYQPLGKHMVASNIPAYYDEGFKQTVLSRAKLKGNEEYQRFVKLFRNFERNPQAFNKRKQYWHDRTNNTWWCRLAFKAGPDPVKSNIPLKDTQASLTARPPVKVGLAPGEVLPSGEEIIERSIKQTGGREALAKIRNRLIKGTIEIGQFKGTITIFQARPNKNYTRTQFGVDAATIAIEQGTNGEVAWELHSMTGPRIMAGQEKTLTLLQSNFDETNYQQLYDKIECMGMEQVEGEVCYKVIQIPKQAEPITLYYSKESGFAVKSTYTFKEQSEKIESENWTRDYKKVDGILYPHHVVIKVMNMETHIRIESIEHNAELPTDRFEVPEAVKKILKSSSAL